LWLSGFEIVSFTIFDEMKIFPPPPPPTGGFTPTGGEGKEEEGKIIYVLRLGFKKGIESHH
jgi:hypothetical protein